MACISGFGIAYSTTTYYQTISVSTGHNGYLIHMQANSTCDDIRGIEVHAGTTYSPNEMAFVEYTGTGIKQLWTNPHTGNLYLGGNPNDLNNTGWLILNNIKLRDMGNFTHEYHISVMNDTICFDDLATGHEYKVNLTQIK